MRAGNELAFDVIYARHGAAVRRFVAGMLRNGPETDDVLQDVFTRAFVHLRAHGGEVDELRPWLYRVARNRVIDVIRARRPRASPEHEHRSDASVEVVVDLRQRLDDTVAAVRALPEHQRRALVLHALEGRSYAEVGEALAVSPHAAKSLAFRGREQLRRDLAA